MQPDTLTSEDALVTAASIGADFIPLYSRSWILGVTFDTHFTFAPRVVNVATSARSQLNILMALAGTSWGQPQRTWYSLTRHSSSRSFPMWHWSGSQMPLTLPWTPCRSSRTLLSDSPQGPWRWPHGITFIGRRDSWPSASHSPYWALNIWTALFSLNIPPTPTSDLSLALEPFTTPSSPASSPSSSSFSWLMAPSLPLTMLRCFVSCTNQGLRRLSGVSTMPPNRVLSVAPPDVAEEERFFSLPPLTSVLVSCRPFVTTFTGSAASPPLLARSAETLPTRSCTCSPVLLSPRTSWWWICWSLASLQLSSLPTSYLAPFPLPPGHKDALVYYC